MPGLGGERWKVLSPHLDRAFEMTTHERGPWLDALSDDDPALAAELRSLLNEHTLLGEVRFLEQSLSVFNPMAWAGQSLGAYTLESLVGEGGMGSVWRARRSDGRFEGVVAVKLLRAAQISAGAAERFRREGSILARLTHPSIAHLLDAGVTPAGQPYLVLEFVEGAHIDQYCDRLALDIEARVRLFLEVLSAVSHAHGQLVVHRDIKPSNVLVRLDGQVKLVDFGIAKLLEAEQESGAAAALTREGHTPLTPKFAAPEQVIGQAVTTSTDVYALGVLLYTLLSGHDPFDDRTLSRLELLNAVVDTDPVRPSDAVASGADADENATRRGSTIVRLRRELRGDLDLIVHRAMKKKPEERYRSVEALADDLRRYLNHQPVLARPDSLSYRTFKLMQRHRRLTAVIALAVMAIVTALGVALWQANEARQQRDRALHLLARSDALTEFFEFLLNDAGAPDQPLTIAALLARSESLLDNEFAANPEHQAAILNVQGAYLSTLGEAADAKARLDRAQSLAASSSDADLRANIDCLHGYVLSLVGKVDEGVGEIDRVLSAPRQSPLLPMTAAKCYQNRAYIAQNQLDGAAADKFAEAAQAAMRTADRPSPIMEASLLSDRGYAQQLLGRLGDANRLYAQALEKMTALGRAGTPGALAIRNNWGIAILSSGDVKGALAVYEDAVAAVKARDKDSPPPAFLAGNLAKALELAGRYDEALKLYEDAERGARANSRAETIAFSLIGQAGVHVELGHVDRAAALIEELRLAFGGSIPKGPAAFTVMVLNGRIALQRGQLAEARRILGEALSAFQGLRNPSAVMVRLYLADVSLRLQRADEAAMFAQRAVEESQTLQGGIRHSSRTGMSYLRLAEARLAQGDSGAARQALAPALEHLQAALGPEHPATKRAVALEARMTRAALTAPLSR